MTDIQRDLQGRAALVTGAARGIGRGIALELARAGAAVAVADLEPTNPESAAAEVRVLGGDAIAIELDVTDAGSVDRCVARAIEHFSRVDILVNNAGIFQRSLGLEQDEDDFNRCLDVNLTGIWRMVLALVPHFRANGGGRIVNISSVGGRRAVDFAAGYCASKAGVISLTQSLALALADDGINVNTVCPGSVDTAMQEAIRGLRGGLDGGAERTMSLPGPLTASDIGSAVAFFASDYARNITGQALNVDCGSTMN